MELIKAFGIDYKILLAQLVNFAILFFVLYKFGYKPIFQFLEDRRKRIKEGVDMAEKMEAALSEALAEKNTIIANAKKDAAVILEKADDLSKKRKEEMIEKAKEEIGKVINQEKEKMRTEKAQTLKEIKDEVAELVIVSLEKILEEKADSSKDKEIIKKVLKSN